MARGPTAGADKLEPRQGAGRRRRQKPIGWPHVLLGMLVAAAGTVVLLEAVETAFWWAGVLVQLLGLTLVLSGIGATERRSQVSKSVPALRRRTGAPPAAGAPSIGEIAVHQVGFISEEQLQEALVRQENERTPLGETLVAMGLISPEQLDELLAIQTRHADSWGDAE